MSLTRDNDCPAAREELSTLRGGLVLRGALRRHVRGCEGCRAFRAELKRQHAAFAILLPVVPTAGLKTATMGAVLGGSAATAVVGGGAAGGGGAVAGLAAGGKAGAAKVLVAVAIAGGGVGAGVAEVDHLRGDDKPAPEKVRTEPGGNGHAGKHRGAGTATPAGAPGRRGAKKHGAKAHGHAQSGRPSSSPAQSPNAATGKGIAGTQHGAKGKAGAPGQLKQPIGKQRIRKVHVPKPMPESAKKPAAPPSHVKPEPEPKVKPEPKALGLQQQ